MINAGNPGYHSGDHTPSIFSTGYSDMNLPPFPLIPSPITEIVG